MEGDAAKGGPTKKMLATMKKVRDKYLKEKQDGRGNE